MTLLQLLLLYIFFRLKQYLSDFLLQSDWMAHNKGMPGKEGFRALFSHTIIHALGTTFIALIFAPALWWLGIVDFVVHSFIDRVKGIFTWKKNWGPKDYLLVDLWPGSGSPQLFAPCLYYHNRCVSRRYPPINCLTCHGLDV